ncbi:MAG: ATPase [Clostridia bacterium]|nr:ATPase [Clostridia bacterium]
MENIKLAIENAQTALGIEFGSTRIKAVLIGKNHEPLASGSFDWENSYDNGVWTYPLEQVWEGLRGAFAKLKANVFEKYGVKLTSVGALGISGMMHGYLAFDKDGNLLAPFRTWRNTITAKAAEELSALFDFNIPQRWSIAHLYQAILNGEEHVKDVEYIATLAAYVHWKLTGNKVIGVGEASGMFPIDSETNDYDKKMLSLFSEKVSQFPWNIENILPKVLIAGENAGTLTEEGALLLDPTGEFKAGIPLCPPEGDAGTGMVATNSVGVRTGNVSAGTSIFLMVVLEKALSKLYPEIDMVTTPAGKPVAMVHCNNCSGEIDAWAGMFTSMCKALGMDISIYKVLDKMFEKALEGDKDCGGLVAYNYISGEVITGLDSGKPMFFRGPESKFTLENFARVQLSSAAATLSIGMEILADEDVKIDRILGHGGYFKAPVAGQKIMGAALNAPVSVMKTAGEGGPWGVAILAEYMVSKSENEALDEYLENKVFAGQDSTEIRPDADDIEGFKAFLENYKKGLAAEKAAVDAF